MNQKEGLNILDFLATGINKQDPAIKAIISDESGEGAIANEAEALSAFINYYTRTDNVINHGKTSLEMIARLFANLRRRVNENDEVLLRRLLALTARKGDTIWGNALDLKHVFESYFHDINCFVAENTNEESLLNDGGFETDNSWTLNGGATYSPDARFGGKRGLLLNDTDTDQKCLQSMSRLFLAGNYTLHFMLLGKCGVIIQNDEGQYFNANDQKFSGDTVLEWKDSEVINYFDKSDGWDDAYCFVVLPVDRHSITIKFVNIEGEQAYIDHARFFSKPLNPSYTLIFQYEGYSITKKSLHMGLDGEDPIQGVNYGNESYFDYAFIVGPTGVSQSQAFKSVLELVRPRGIQAFTEFVEKNSVEEET